MAWRIRSWSPDLGEGTIASPHFGPIAFDAIANVDGITDFQGGEAVDVELDGQAPKFSVRVIRRTVARQPPDTACPAFDLVNRKFDDAFLESHSEQSLQFWLGSCCEYCTPNPTRVRFDGVSAVQGLEDATIFTDPVFRLASPDEVAAANLQVEPDTSAFCLTSFGERRDGPRVLFVARAVEILPPRQQ
jgi:hypothetical protein